MTIRRISGGTLDTANLDAVKQTDGHYEFYNVKGNGERENVTFDITREDKRELVPDLNEQAENLHASKVLGATKGKSYDERYSTTQILVDQVTTDPLGAPLETLDEGVSKIVNSRGIQTIALAGVALAVLLILAKD